VKSRVVSFGVLKKALHKADYIEASAAPILRFLRIHRTIYLESYAVPSIRSFIKIVSFSYYVSFPLIVAILNKDSYT
jgi:hypothetical protein